MLAYKKFPDEASQKSVEKRQFWKASQKIGIQSLRDGNSLSMTAEILMSRKRFQLHEQQTHGC